jgi:hypothetical protein
MMAKRKAKKAPPAHKRVGKPPVRATARLSAPVDKDLLAQAERFARAHQTTVSELVAEGLRRVVGATRAPVLPPAGAASQPADGPWGQLLAWMEEQQQTLTQIRDALGDVAASLPNDSSPPPPSASTPDTPTSPT